MENSDPHIVVAGAGSIGCFVGGLLAAAGCNVTLLARPRIAAEIRAHGLTLTDLDGMAVRVGADEIGVRTEPSALATADVVLVTVKSRDTEAIGALIDTHAGRAAQVVSLQNGVTNAPELCRLLAALDVRAGMVPFNVVPMGQGCYHRAVAGDIVIEAGAGDLASVLSVPGLVCTESREIENVQWGKFLMNLNNALNALSGMPIQAQLKNRDWRRLMADQWSEALRVIQRHGIRPMSSTPVPVSMIPWVLRLPTGVFTRVAAAMLRIDPQARTSMSYDLMEGRATEIDALQGVVVRMGQTLGIATPINAMVWDVMCAAELAGEGLPDLTPQALRRELATIVAPAQPSDRA
ncbi:2-dehydropantoate 2-reductase [Sulfitobacter sp. M57]|uniref:2-dehydropantoate 2-reductase n=1 Tax=unclassified Sulfitobacter TaxID=196795 RepID=UPI0023E0CE88|nr:MULTISPECIES: 2-dehydropantoate 2-reductase [unclassified Sulfitobacter]MDF3415766.1 2-dehydropantoate 2-reductase [Sulfitobacter sp. KE5]MDF3423246.1 2-dehydropantoate 2-reductase [Sulfitobacter sp. KE43]MDF3434312.1 2-dehydropantoate 2-reductase [Sulfitobacter sp. KE42]MDF3459655.1 2-dehydropantoate 2-reductase [Sulfitobacter sp. S74]MDF3463850.1 2-dehydropantoate 2-reductase [Sulfitobacter sp. Ks18]